MKQTEYIAYQGKAFTIEWYVNQDGISPALDYYNALPAKERILLLRLFKVMGDFGQIRDKTKFNYEHDGIYAFKPKPFRFLAFFMEGKKLLSPMPLKSSSLNCQRQKKNGLY